MNMIRVSAMVITPYEGGIFRLTSKIGYRNIPELGYVNNPHYGIDLVGISSKNITCVGAGTVGWAGYRDDKAAGGATWQWGNYVRVDMDDGRSMYYCHMSAVRCTVGQKVIVGTILGTEGATGQATGSHLHLELRKGARKCALPASDSDECNAAAYIGITNAAGLYRAEDPIEAIIEECRLSSTWKAPMTQFQAAYPYGYQFWRKIAEELKR